jgi:GPI mannosyltransferase 1 subunit M
LFFDCFIDFWIDFWVLHWSFGFSQGKSPYERDGYRYTPILAYLVLPNMWLHPAFGKVFFAALDIVAAYLTFILLQRMKVRNAEMKFSMLLCLYNPVTINVSTRGNAESVMSVLCLLTLLLHTNLSFFLSGLVFGLSVHFKIYPVCYALPLYFWCSSGRRLGLAELLSPTPQKAKFVAGAAISFLTLTAFFYLLYGQEFLQETYFYHLTRRDTQHNFSVWFYILRIFEKSPWEAILNFLPFLIQGVFWAVFSLRFYRDLPFVCFLNTAVFVILNKVCTVQVCEELKPTTLCPTL